MRQNKTLWDSLIGADSVERDGTLEQHGATSWAVPTLRALMPRIRADSAKGGFHSVRGSLWIQPFGSPRLVTQ